MIRRYSPLAVSLAVLTLFATPVLAQEADVPVAEAPEPIVFDDEGRSAYGLFLVGRMASTEGEAGIGADYLRQAQELMPDNPDLRLQAFTSSLIGGDLAYAARLAPEGEGIPPVLSEAGRLVEAIQFVITGQPGAGHALLTAQPIGRPHARAGAYVAPFIAALAGDWDRALAPIRPGLPGVDNLFHRYHRAVLLEIRGQYAEADAEYQTLLRGPGGRKLFTLSYGEFLERRGRRDEAVAAYDAARAEGGDEASLTHARTRAAQRRPAPPLPTLRRAAGMALENAALQSSVEGAHEFAAVYLRLAYDLSPNVETLLNVGVSLAEAQLELAARNTFDRIGPEAGALYVEARVQAGLSYQREAMPDQALAEFQTAFTAKPTDAGIAFLLAEQLTRMERYSEALTLVDGPLLNTADQGHTIRVLRATIYEATGRLDEAEAELWAANVAQPDDPAVLNQLGYIWVDRGLRVDQGTELIQRAAEIDPGNVGIQASLGWARYRQGQYDLAVEILEEAVDKKPADPVINDHLGDVYWQVGRRREAIFQWNRVLTLEPDTALRAEAERKIEGGLPSGT